MKTFLDDRGFSIHDVFPLKDGQINYSELVPGVVKAFHRHQKQTDYWCVIRGNAKIVLVDESSGKPEIKVHCIGEQNVQVIAIPPGVWHGYTSIGNEKSAMLYWVTEKYDKNQPDEERLAWDHFGAEVWSVDNK
ncbi:MAG TPA: spore coat protein [Cyanobacteria bacterium UBA8530]|nr:spore coat protein [Cyanobacteria bacterium UBA8530]